MLRESDLVPKLSGTAVPFIETLEENLQRRFTEPQCNCEYQRAIFEIPVKL